MMTMENRFGFIALEESDKSIRQPSQSEEAKELAAIIHAIQKTKSLKELGETLPKLSGKGKWKDWEIDYWDKNGEARFYLRRSGLKRGYFKVLSSGMFIGDEIIEHKGDKFPSMPFIPSNLEGLPHGRKWFN